MNKGKENPECVTVKSACLFLPAPLPAFALIARYSSLSKYASLTSVSIVAMFVVYTHRDMFTFNGSGFRGRPEETG